MAARYSALFIGVLVCFSYASGEDLKPAEETSQDAVPVPASPEHAGKLTIVTVEDLKPRAEILEEHVNKAKEHVDRMLNTSLTSHQEKLHPLVKNESDHMAHELKQSATKLADLVSVGEHTAAVKDAVLASVPVLNEAAASLEHTGDGDDLIQQNTKYFEAANKLIQEIKKILNVGPCGKVVHAVKGVMFELQHDVDNYQWGIHNEMGFAKADHHVHKHHGSSSEESNSQESSELHQHS